MLPIGGSLGIFKGRKESVRLESASKFHPLGEHLAL
jgi:hypothetical protein